MAISPPSPLLQLSKGFVASCQPLDNSPMDRPEIVAAMAQSAIIGGAVAVRIEGVENLKAVRKCINSPIIGIIKRDLSDSDVRITPFIEDVMALAKAGADIIAIDATKRARPVAVNVLIDAIKKAGCLVMADCANLEEGLKSRELGADIIGTTLSGYTGGKTPIEPDLAFVRALKNQGCYVMAEGRYNSPELAEKAIKAGADCITIGSAITRIEHICTWFDEAITRAKQPEVEMIL